MTAVFLYGFIYLGLFFFTDLLYHKYDYKATNTRKIVHISTGLIALTFLVYLNEIWQIILLCGSFLVLMTVSEKLKWFKSITAIDRKSYGSWLFSVVVMLCFYIQNKTTQTEYYYLPLLVLTICDPMAAIIGNKLNFISLNIFGHLKTIGGSLAFFVTALLLLSALNHYFYSFNVYAIFLFASLSTIAELLSTRGWDNLTIPTSISFLIYLV